MKLMIFVCGMTLIALMGSMAYRGGKDGAEIARLRVELEDARCDLERCHCGAVAP